MGSGSAVDAFEPAIRRLLAVTPEMAATVIAERIGWTRGMTVLRDRVAELRPVYRLPEAFGHTEYKPGELAQWDLWFPDYTSQSANSPRQPLARSPLALPHPPGRLQRSRPRRQPHTRPHPNGGLNA